MKKNVAAKKIREAQASLDDLKGAETAALVLKTHIITLTRSIDNLVTVAVREPLQMMSFTSSFRLEDYFQDHPEALKLFRESVLALDGKCRQDDKKWAAMKSIVDLSPICNIGSVEDAVTGVEAVIRGRMEQVKQRLEAALKLVMGYETPDESDDAAVSLAPVMSDEPFYVNYLKAWEAQGQFQELLAKVGSLVQEVDNKHKDAMKAVESLTENIKANLQKADQARQYLRAALASNTIAAANKQKIEGILHASEQAVQETEGRMDLLDKAAQEARKAYEASKEDFRETFDVGTGKAVSMLQQLFRKHQTQVEAVVRHIAMRPAGNRSAIS